MKKYIIGLLTIVSYALFIGFFFTNKIMYIRKKTDKEIIDRETNDGHFKIEDFEALEKEEICIPSTFGYNIKGSIIAPHHTNRYIIICHGVTVNKFNSIKYMNLFLEKGWNVLIYDHRRHGTSGGKTTSYGYYEKFDLQSIVHFLKKRVGKNIILGIHGESMGAATTLLYAGSVEDGADFYIVDCPFSDLESLLRYRLKMEFRIPGFLVMPFAKPFITLRDRYSLKDVSPITVIEKIKNPVLFIHSKQDDYILPEMSKQLYDKKPGFKKIYLAEKGSHAMSFTENKEEYNKAIDHFLTEISL
ncbi:alpha/beta hydrolase [Metabacillus fastidiosus]|uniref:Alpha/beta hydrolase n=1 Tax=Metabacillus fastidiosus TaxID=1458 RepID=A0ABU6NX19_9BACI|nr:alpha/beta hydrolase [Metabacillus fastidiosus]